MSRMCAYGNCDETDCPITLSNRKAEYRNQFCSEDHAASWLEEQKRHRQIQKNFQRPQTEAAKETT